MVATKGMVVICYQILCLYWITKKSASGPVLKMLWFAFILFLNDLWHNPVAPATNSTPVVICFHSFSQRSLTQRLWFYLLFYNSCDLLSFFFSTIFDTTYWKREKKILMLWFAFILFLNDLWHNNPMSSLIFNGVVICFHSFSQRSLTQLILVL